VRSGWLILVALGVSALAQTPGDAELNSAYKALSAKDYDNAIALFRKGLAAQPQNAKVHKDLAYTLLKAGENADARDEFERALQIDPKDETAALEFAFLAYETKKPIDARRMFDKLRHSANPATRATAEQAFQNIDKPLADGIARWQEALRRAPDPNALSTFSAHWELAQTAELRDDLPLAAEQFEICRKLKPQLPELLLILGRVWAAGGRAEEAHAALLAASRSKDSRTAEQALAQLGTRYPYPYEFTAAIKLDPQNVTLRKELAYLYLAMHKQAEAIEQFEQILVLDASDAAVREQLDALRGLKSRPAASAPQAAKVDAKAMGLKSLKLGYMRDAIRYLQQAHEENPEDAEVLLGLGYAYNLAKDDSEALVWFNRARQSDDPATAAEASKAYHNLRGDPTPETSVFTTPVFSTRWHDAFAWGQVKRTIPMPWLGNANRFLSFYVSALFDGDLKGSVPNQALAPQYLSTSSVTLGAGVSTRTWHHITASVQAGEAINYLPSRHDVGRAIPDYRADLNFVKGFGHLLGSKNNGLFYETTADAVYIHRFDKDWLFYWDNRAGETLHFGGSFSAQALFNLNYVRDLKSEYWANTLEMGPGLKFHTPGMPPNLYLSIDALHGFYTAWSPKPNYNDLRVSITYGATKTTKW
jgi:tetratricopeptide (TPR) repeat protein